MTSKERAGLRAKANALEAVFQIGKGGISEALIAQTDDALRVRELIKLKVLLETSPEKPKELAQSIAASTGADVVQVVGGSIVLYRENPELHQPQKKVASTANKKKTNTISKPRIPRDKKPDARKRAGTAQKPKLDETGIAAEKLAAKKAVHKPLHQGRPRNATGRKK
jgi:RNA-binding protein